MRQCTEADRRDILDYISREPEMNLFVFGDIEAFGLEDGPVHVYVPEKDGEWDCLILQYFDFYNVYSHKAVYNAAAVAEFLAGRRLKSVSGKREQVEQLALYFPKLNVQTTYMSRCDGVLVRDVPPRDAEVRQLGADDAEEVTRLLSEIEEFAPNFRGENAFAESVEQNRVNVEKGGLLYGVYCGGILAATAQTSAANSQSAMVVCVAARSEFRGRGYATAAVEELCRASFAQGKKFLCLYYDNPAAGRIYHRIGFHEIGQYAMMR
jgi:predicted GNAT family acetyltransferase